MRLSLGLRSRRMSGSVSALSDSRFAWSIAERAPLGVIAFDEHAKVHYCNEFAAKMLGYSRDAMIGMHLSDIDTEFAVERWTPRWASVVDGTIDPSPYERHCRHRDGPVVPVEAVAAACEHDGVTFALTYIRDITQRHVDASRMKAAHGALEFAQRIAQLGHWRHDPGPDALEWSNETYRIFGEEPECAEPAYADDGTPKYTMGTVHNITNAKKSCASARSAISLLCAARMTGCGIGVL
jgi:PAS domain S-box-containing protein